MGLVYAGLTKVAGGPCGTLWQFDMPGYPRCTHGPDPGPPGVDVRRHRSLADLRAALPARALFSLSPTASKVPCIGNGTSGARVQAIYAHPPAYDNLATLSPLIKSYAAEVDETYARSAAETGGERHVRFVTTPGCDLSILDVTARSDTADHTFQDLVNQGYTRNDRKYLVWMDASVICGIGESYGDETPGPQNANNGPRGVPGMMARIDRACWGEYSNLARGSTEAHELTHTLGAVLEDAPHATDYGHCWDAHDVMCYEDGPTTVLQNTCSITHQQLLDCNYDDYFNTNPGPGNWLRTHWNTANNQFLDGAVSADTTAPVVHARAAKIKRRKTGKLRFDVSDDSGSVSVQVAVFRGQKQLRHWGPEDAKNGNYYVTWKAPARPAHLDFCVAAQDTSGNASGTACAGLRVT